MAQIIRDRPFVEQGALSDRWYCVLTWFEWPNHVREAVTKVDVTESVQRAIDLAVGDALEEARVVREREDDEARDPYMGVGL